MPLPSLPPLPSQASRHVKAICAARDNNEQQEAFRKQQDLCSQLNQKQQLNQKCKLPPIIHQPTLHLGTVENAGREGLEPIIKNIELRRRNLASLDTTKQALDSLLEELADKKEEEFKSFTEEQVAGFDNQPGSAYRTTDRSQIPPWRRRRRRLCR